MLASVLGILPVNNFKPRAMAVRRAETNAVRPNIAAPNGFNLIGAADLATIYNFNPLFKAGITGKGQTIVVIEDTDLFTNDDFMLFPRIWALAAFIPQVTYPRQRPRSKR